MTIFYDPKYEKVSELVSKYMLYDEENEVYNTWRLSKRSLWSI